MLVGSIDLTDALDHFARSIGRKLNHDLPLRAFSQTIWAGPINDSNPQVQGYARWNDAIYVYAYTATVAGLRFVENSTQAPQSQFYDPRDYICVSLTDTSNQAITIANSAAMPGALVNGIALSEMAGKGGFSQQTLATPYTSGSQVNATFTRMPNCGVDRVGAVGLTCWYVRLPVF